MMLGTHAGRTRRLGAAVTLAATLLLAACSSSGGPSSASSAAGGSAASGSGGGCAGLPSGPIKIYNILSLTGPLANDGAAQENADSVAVKVFNEHESICGHTVDLQVMDDKGDPATALNDARQIVSSNSTLMLNDSFGAQQDAIAPYLMKSKVVTFTGAALSSVVGQPANPTAFSFGPSGAEYASTMVAYAKAHNEDNLGLIGDGTTFSNEIVADARADAAKSGLTVKGSETYSPTAVDLSTPLSQLRKDGVQTLVAGGQTQLPAMASSMEQIGWSPAVVGWGGFADFGVPASQLPANTADFCYAPYSTSLLTPLNTELLTDEEKAIGLNSGVQNVLLPYASLLVLKHAIEAAGSLDGEKVAAQIESIKNLPTNIPGVDFSFSASNHWGFPPSALSMCRLQPQKFDLFKKAS